MNCKEFSRILSDYLDGTLSEKIKKEADNHLKTCRSCEALVEDVRLIQKYTTEIEIPMPSPYIFQRVKTRVAAEAKKSSHRFIYKLSLGTSFIALILVALFFGIFRNERRYAENKQQIYIVHEESSGYEYPVYNTGGKYILTTYTTGSL